MAGPKHPVPVRTTTPRGDASRRRLLAAARDELVERGGKLEIDSVASRADSSVGLIYRHFGSRAGLIVAVVDEFYGRLRTAMLSADAPEDASVADRERRRVERVVAFHYADPLSAVVLAHLHVDGQVAAREAHQVDTLVSDVAAIVAGAQRSGDAPRDRDARVVAAMVVGGMRQVLATALGSDPQPSEKRTARALWVLVAAAMGIDAD